MNDENNGVPSPEPLASLSRPAQSGPAQSHAAGIDTADPGRIILTGFMGSGKSTIGPLLAAHLGWSFHDLDHEIESTEGLTVAQIFSIRGEPAFRNLEHEAIRRLLGRSQIVLALGGGSIEDHRTRALFAQTPGLLLIHLEVSLETVLDRCRGSESIRPILADKPNLAARYQLRMPLYRQAHLSLPVDSMSPPAIVRELVSYLAAMPGGN
jgi:shikimate kinase